MNTPQAKVAKDAIELLDNRAAAAEQQVHRLARENSELVKRIAEVERRMYESTSRSITNFMRVTGYDDPCLNMKIIRLEPRCAQLAIRQSELFDARNPLDVIDHHIEKVLQMHTDDLREQLRKALWLRR